MMSAEAGVEINSTVRDAATLLSTSALTSKLNGLSTLLGLSEKMKSPAEKEFLGQRFIQYQIIDLVLNDNSHSEVVRIRACWLFGCSAGK